MKGAKIRDTDRGYKKRLAVLEKFQGAKISVGVHENDGAGAHSDGATIADVGAFHEFGTDDIPERSFVRGWFDEQEAENAKLFEGAAKRIATGKAEIQQALDQVGAVMAGNMRARIRDGIAPELADTTVGKKGSSTPLIDTGQLIQAITWKAIE